MNSLRFLRVAVTVVIALASGPAWAAEGAGHDHLPHHHVALFIGGGVETKRDEEHDKGLATGFEYELRFHSLWGVGGVVELLGQDTVRDVVLVAPVSLHPAGGLRLFAGPGVEFTPKKNKAVLRFGGGYEFPLGGHWNLAPEGIADWIEGGAVTWLAGIAIGYEL